MNGAYFKGWGYMRFWEKSERRNGTHASSSFGGPLNVHGVDSPGEIRASSWRRHSERDLIRVLSV